MNYAKGLSFLMLFVELVNIDKNTEFRVLPQNVYLELHTKINSH